MLFSHIIFLIAVTFLWSKAYAKDAYEYKENNFMSKSEFEKAKLLTRFVIDNAPESLKPRLEEKFEQAFTTKWRSSNEFDKHVTAFLDNLEKQISGFRGSIDESRSKRQAKYGSQDFYKAIYVVYIALTAKEDDRPFLKEQLIKVLKMDWNNLEEFKNYCDYIARKIEDLHDKLDY